MLGCMSILYIHPVVRYDRLPKHSLIDLTMSTDDWTQQCVERLHLQWPSVDRQDLEHLAGALHAEERWRAMEPVDAAVQWLRQGIPNVPRAESQVR